MRTSPVLVQTETLCEAKDPHVADAFRTLVGLIEKMSAGAIVEQGKSGSEDVLIDTEVKGSRYLLMRMPQPASSRVQLSPREHEIVRMVAKGHSNKIIADVLNISSWTVSTLAPHIRQAGSRIPSSDGSAFVGDGNSQPPPSMEPIGPIQTSALGTRVWYAPDRG